MHEIELVGGPLDGARAEDYGQLIEGDHIVVEPDDLGEVFYTLHNGLLEFDANLTFGM